jgi:hypothetical protein
MAVINLALNVQIVDGPKLQISRSKTVEAYDKIEVVINPNSTDKAIEIQPGTGSQVGFLLIRSSLYGSEITYKANNGTIDSTSITLDEPQCFLGTGAISVLGGSPKILKFSNAHPASATDKKALIEILVGRDATPTA